MKTLVLASQDVQKIVRQVGLDYLMDTLIQRLEDACRNFQPSQYQIPARDGFNYEHPAQGLLEWMPAMKLGEKVAVKVVGYHPCNVTNGGLPTVISTTSFYTPESGHLAALVDSTFLTSLRTGAASAVASRVLANPSSQVVGIIGAGAQAMTQLHALSRVFNIEKVLVYDIDEETGHDFSQRMTGTGLTAFNIEVAALPAIISSADILCTGTSVGIAKGPVFEDLGLKESIHINAIGSDFPGKTEIPETVLKRSLVCPDFTAQAMQEGECQQLKAGDIGPDLVTLIKNRKQYQSYRDKSTVFDSTGWALEDYIAAEMLIELADAAGCGMQIDLETISADPKNPYGFLSDSGPILAQLASGDYPEQA